MIKVPLLFDRDNGTTTAWQWFKIGDQRPRSGEGPLHLGYRWFYTIGKDLIAMRFVPPQPPVVHEAWRAGSGARAQPQTKRALIYHRPTAVLALFTTMQCSHPQSWRSHCAALLFCAVISKQILRDDQYLSPLLVKVDWYGQAQRPMFLLLSLWFWLHTSNGSFFAALVNSRCGGWGFCEAKYPKDVTENQVWVAFTWSRSEGPPFVCLDTDANAGE